MAFFRNFWAFMLRLVWNPPIEEETARGIALAECGDLPGAERVFRAIIARYPNDSAVHVNLGRVYAERGERERAIEEYETGQRKGTQLNAIKLRALCARMYTMSQALDTVQSPRIYCTSPELGRSRHVHRGA